MYVVVAAAVALKRSLSVGATDGLWRGILLWEIEDGCKISCDKKQSWPALPNKNYKCGTAASVRAVPMGLMRLH